MGVETKQPALSPRALELNMTNEGGVDGTYRLLKNIMGLWLVQQCNRAFAVSGRKYNYDQLTQLAAKSKSTGAIVDVNDSGFLNPPNMPKAIQEYCRRTKQRVPHSDGEIVRCAFENLAIKYAEVLKSLEELTGVPIQVIHIVGGGSKNAFLNQLAANACQRPVIAGPVEATSMGNLLTQVRADGELGSLAEMREIVRNSAPVRYYQPVK
jgi:rhamnulokinase